MLVTIVGKENVGKSTLFNRLAGGRYAVVGNTPGITKDRNIKELNINGKPFSLADTGGYFSSSASKLGDKIRNQIELSINASNLILFLTDVKTGVTPQDLEIAERLRKIKKTTLLLVNKVDNDKEKNIVGEFYKLGFKETFLISSLHNRGIGRVIERIEKEIEREKIEKQNLKNEKYPRIAILGVPNVGKSTYINALLGEERMIVDEAPGTTVDAVDITFKYKDQFLTLIDTPGLKRKKNIRTDVEYYSAIRTKLTISRADVGILLVEGTFPLTHQSKSIIKLLVEAGVGIVLAVNKIDLGVAFNENSLRFGNFIPVVYISALKKLRIYEPLELAIKIYDDLGKRVSMKEVNDRLQRVGVRASCIQVGVRPPTFMIRKKLKPNIQRFVEHSVREVGGFVGVPIRIISKN